MNETLKPWEQGAIYDLRHALKRWPDTLSITLTASRVVIWKDGVEVESFPLKQPTMEMT